MRATTVIGKAADTAEVVVRQLGDLGGGQGRAVARRTLRRGRRMIAYTRGRLAGVRYAAAGRHPDEHVSDDVLADRVRTELGSVLHRLDLPKVHVTVERHVVTLHGDAGSLADVRRISRAVAAVPGVVGVRSALHVGLLPGNYRPSWGKRAAAASPALRRLLGAADRGGVEPAGRADAVRAVLTAVANRLEREEWFDLRAHLPRDVRQLAGRRSSAARKESDLVAAVADVAGLPGPVAAQTVRATVQELTELVPPSATVLRALLPVDLQSPATART